MSRARAIQRHELAPADRGLFDELAVTRVVVDGAVQGPFGVLLHSPEAARLTAQLGAYYRYESGLPSRVRHLAAMIVAQAMACQYEFTVHAELGRADGIPAVAVTEIGEGREPTDLPDEELAIVRFVRQLVTAHDVDDATYDAAHDRLGSRGLTDLVGNVGYLMMLAGPINVFRVDVRPGQRRELPTDGPADGGART